MEPEFTQEHIAQLASLIADNPQATRAQLEHLVCRQLDWHKPDGGLEEMSCRVATPRLHREGLTRLPPPRNRLGSSRVERSLPGAPEIRCRPAHKMGGLQRLVVWRWRSSWNAVQTGFPIARMRSSQSRLRHRSR